ncbi:MAG TPA: PocR ligand-binding domain-containing protein [Candidatus Sulfotelmatobacter sp.]|nr:PocR ligand-binding domain-containing protein [Candidatus Sulfotelmatobacter sp.]
MSFTKSRSQRQLRKELKQLQTRLAESEATMQAIRAGNVDAIMVEGPNGSRIFTLQSPEDPYRMLAERMNEGAATLTAEGVILFCNRRLAEMAGLPVERLLGTSFLLILRDSERESFPDLLCRASKEDVRAEGHLRRDGGAILPVQLSLVSIPLAELEQGICLIATDLSNQKRAEEAKASIVDSSDDAIVAKTPDGIITSWNRGAQELYGYSTQEMIGESICRLVPPDRISEFNAIMQRIKQGERVRHYETVRVRKGGRLVHVSLTISPIRDGAGKILGASTIARDITERKRAEAETIRLNQELEERVQQRTAQLRESEQSVRRKLDSIMTPEGDLGSLELRDILDIPAIRALMESFHSIVHGVAALLDVRGNVLSAVGWQDICEKFHRVNAESCKNCRESDLQLSKGAVPGEFKLYKCKNNLWDVVTPIMLGGRHMGNLFSGQFFLADEPLDYEVFRAQARKYGFNEQEYMAALERVPCLTREEVNASMGFLAKMAQMISQLSYSSIKLARSMTESRRANQDLAASVKELEAFTYSVSHDLRAPLRHISGFSKILSEEFGPHLPPDAQHHLQRIEEGTRRMGLLVDDLLKLARVGRCDLTLRVTELKSLVEEVIAEQAPERANRQVEWKIGNLDPVACDPGLMKQVFQNLLSNALKFTRPRAQAVIEVGQNNEAGSPVVFVRDNGVGFNMKYADKLFGVFQRLHRPEDFEGTGVGLATVQRIVEKHGGRSWAEAELDKGATFYFTLGFPRKSDTGQKRQ